MKESLYSGDKNEIIRATFESEDKLREFGFITSGLTFSNGIAIFSSAYMTSARPLNGVYSVRFRLTSLTPSTTNYLLDCRANSGTGYIRIDSATAVSASSGTIYVDGVATSTISANSKEIVVSGITLVSTLFYVGRINSSGANYLNGSMDLFSIWNRSLVLNEVKALYDNSFFKTHEYPKTNIYVENSQNWYGVRCSILTSTDGSMERIGNLALHRSLPIQNRIRRCVLNDAGQVVYYLNPSNSLLKAGGGIANLDGTDGQWMVEIPYHWIKEEINGNYHYFKFSELPLVGYDYIPRHYESAGEANLQRSTSKLSCVINTSADYRGGNNNSTNDANEKTFLGRPATSISRTNFRTYANNRGTGWMLDVPVTYNAVRRLMFCEFASRNTQLAVNNTLTTQGFRQGGLGNGVTTASSSEWSNFNGYNPFVAIGVTASLGNASGEVSVSVTNFGGAGVNRTFTVPSYRGIENPFGHIWKWLDGYNIWAQTAGEGSKTLLYYKSGNSGLADETSSGYTLIGELPRSSDYFRNSHKKHLFPISVGGVGSGSTTFYCDYFYTDATTSFGWRAPLVGGGANSGSNAGPVYVFTSIAASDTDTHVGSRLCFLPNYNPA